MRNKQVDGRKDRLSLASRIRTRCSRSDEQGSALVEFTLCALVFLTMIFGILEFGYAVFSYNFVSNAAREGSRFVMVRGKTCSGLSGGCPISGCGPSVNCDTLQTQINKLAVGINTSNLTVKASCVTSPGVFATLPCAPGVPVQVKVQYVFTLFAPLNSRSLTMTSTSQRVVWQ